jgi:hypothetical protein
MSQRSEPYSLWVNSGDAGKIRTIRHRGDNAAAWRRSDSAPPRPSPTPSANCELRNFGMLFPVRATKNPKIQRRADQAHTEFAKNNAGPVLASIGYDPIVQPFE